MAPSTITTFTVEFYAPVGGHGFTTWELPAGGGAVLSAVKSWERDGVFHIIRVTRDFDGAVMVSEGVLP